MALYYLLTTLLTSLLITSAKAAPDAKPSATAAPGRRFPIPQGALDFAERVQNGTITSVKIIPGPGLPSLESLGLTAHDLVVSTVAQIKSSQGLVARGFDNGWSANSARSGQSLEKRDHGCWVKPQGQPHIDATWACFLYLWNLGTTACWSSEETQLCNAVLSHPGHTHHVYITGRDHCAGDWTSSYCSDVALGVNAVVAWCTSCQDYYLYSGAFENYCGVGGYDYAYGNGCFEVRVRRGPNTD